VKNEQSNQQGSALPAELAAPAQRALAGAGIRRLDQLSEMTEAEVKQLHGIGKNAISQLQRALQAKGLSFAQGKSESGKKEKRQ
jgi:DNA-directed RNA polymerase alpha subunit